MKKLFSGPSAFLSLAVAAILSCGIAAYLFSHVEWLWKVFGVLGIASFGAFIYLDRKHLGDTMSKRSTRYGVNSVVMSILVFGIVVVMNMIATNHDIKKDVTKNKLHTLSEQSVKVLKGLQTDVTLRTFVNPMQIPDFNNIFEKYTYHTNKLKREFVDVDKEPLQVQKYGIKQAGTIIVESDTRSARVEGLSGPDDPKAEEKITNAIISVAKGEKKKAYFLTGHGERSTADTGREGYSEIKATLESGRYNVADLNLMEKGSMPADADLLVIAGPRSKFLDTELTTIENYIKKGGDALIMVEPISSDNLKPFLAKFGIDWKAKKAVLETNQLQQLAGGNALTPIVTSYDKSHEITRELHDMTIFAVATPIEKAATTPPGMTVTPLFSTSTRSFEVSVEGDKVKVNEKTDRRGPISLAAAVTGKVEGAEKKAEPKADPAAAEKPEDKNEGEFRVVVVGDADFGANGVRGFGVNSDLFQNMLSWLSQEEDLIAIRPRPTGLGELDITAQRASIINLVSIIVAPFSMFIAGIVVWLSRRKR